MVVALLLPAWFANRSRRSQRDLSATEQYRTERTRVTPEPI
ncbi:hypothetical protein BN903_3 [Halorubrum sp. AJ67]|nr:hypothetical protein BN903_3 [Halorubrum sp. AJ67]